MALEQVCSPGIKGSRNSLSYTSWHILINVLRYVLGALEMVSTSFTDMSQSTLLLAASNSVAQILAAPTREEINSAHAVGKYLHVGVFAFKNLAYISKWRRLLCVLIGLSSIPLHLLWVLSVRK